MFARKLSQQHILITLFLLSVFILAVCKIEDTDAWMHLSLGKEIFKLRGLPAKEIFEYTMSDKPFLYTSWLFGIIYYLSYLAFNVYGVILLKAITITIVFYILLRDSLKPYRNYVIVLIVMTLVAIMIRHRFVERPETFMMVFLSFSIFSLNAFIYDNKKYIYSLPLVHLLWANSHSSINLMFVPFLSFIAGGLLQRYLNKKGLNFSNTPAPSQIKTIMLIFAASFTASLINPYFINQYFYGVHVLASQKLLFLELHKPVWPFNKLPYILSVVIIMSFILNWRRLSLIHLLLIIPFIILPFTAKRFIFFLGIVAGPILARNLSSFFDSMHWSDFFSKKPIVAAVAVWIILYSTLTLSKTGPFGEDRKVFGFGVNYNTVPEGALKYMDGKGISGRVFNVFDWGGYIKWRDFPSRSVFVDPRVYLPDDLSVKMIMALQGSDTLGELENKYGFDAVLVKYPVSVVTASFQETDLGLPHPQWALVYWDDLSLLYLKKSGKYDPLIQEETYRFIKPANPVPFQKLRLHDDNYRLGVMKELERNIGQTGSARAYAFLGFLYNERGSYREALEAFSKGLSTPSGTLVKVYDGMAYAHYNLGHPDESIKYYKKSLALYEDPVILYKTGMAYIKKGKKKAALPYLEKALSLNPNLTSNYKILMNIYKELGMDEEVNTMTQFRNRLGNKAGEHFKNGLGAYLNGSLGVAYTEFKKAIRENPSDPVSFSNLGYVCLDSDVIDEAFEYQQRAIEIDAFYANAHYGLALIYKKWGDFQMAKKHWKEYLKIEPEGSYSRKAMEEIKALESYTQQG